MFTDQFTILMSSLLKFLSQSLIILEFKPHWLYFQVCMTKLNELVLLSKSYINSFQKACVVNLLYSQILKKSTNDLAFLTKKVKIANKLVVLKQLTF